MSAINEAESTGDSQNPGKRKSNRGRKPNTLTAYQKTVMGLAIGKNRVIVDPNEVYKLAALGLRTMEMANFFGVNKDTLSVNFQAQILKGREDMKISLRKAMLNNACVNNNAAVQIFLAKNLLGMSDNPANTQDVQVLPWSEDDASPSPTNSTTNSTNHSQEQLDD